LLRITIINDQNVLDNTGNVHIQILYDKRPSSFHEPVHITTTFIFR
jgi:hypothetical protein